MSAAVIFWQLLIVVTVSVAAAMKGFKGLGGAALFWGLWTCVMVFAPWLAFVQFFMIVVASIIATPIAILYEVVDGMARRSAGKSEKSNGKPTKSKPSVLVTRPLPGESPFGTLERRRRKEMEAMAGASVTLRGQRAKKSWWNWWKGRSGKRKCWNCGGKIHSRLHRKCSVCGWYLCTSCGMCRGGCLGIGK